jgi:hypothetical protein
VPARIFRHGREGTAVPAGAVGFVITVVGLMLITLGLAGGALRPS